MAIRKSGKKTKARREKEPIRPEFRKIEDYGCHIPNHLVAAFNSFTAAPSADEIRETVRLANELTLEKVRSLRECGGDKGAPLLDI